MSLVLLYATGLFLRSMERASGIDIGFRSRGILMRNICARCPVSRGVGNCERRATGLYWCQRASAQA